MTDCPPIRAAIVDDEPLARRGIRARLARWAQVEVVAESGDAREGIRELRRHQPDVVFLDIEMPGADGFTLLERLPPEARPLSIFVTAHADRALRAYELEAFDYLLKPIDDERFARTMERVLERLAERGTHRIERLVVRDRGRSIALDPRTIDWVNSEGDYVRIHAGASTYLHAATLASVESLLPKDRFARIHRTTLVNVERIHALEPLTNGDHVVQLTSGHRLKLSRTHRDTLAKRLRLKL
jgi:two-component system LytT family response regulator